MLKHIIWDFDGTLFDTYPGIVDAFQKALNNYGIYESKEVIMNHMMISVSHTLRHYMNKFQLNNEFYQIFNNYEINVPINMIVPFPYAIDICQKVKVNGGHNYIYTHRGDSTYHILEHHQMHDLFDEVVTNLNQLKRKPDKEGFEYIINKHHLDKSTVLVVGDREVDIKGARNAGITSCLFQSRVSLDIDADYKVESLDELNQIIK